MTRKHFKEIAEALWQIRDRDIRKIVAEALCSALKSYNSRFNREIFIDHAMGER